MIEDLIIQRFISLKQEYSGIKIFILADYIKELKTIYPNLNFEEIIKAVIPNKKNTT